MNKEIKGVIFAMDNNKVPGLDSYRAFFFKQAWDVVGFDIVKDV